MRLSYMNLGHARARLVQAGAVFAAIALVTGCGGQYKPVVTPISPSGPAAQTTSYAVVVSAPSSTAAGVATVIDYSGDTVMASASIGPSPTNFTIDEAGSIGYTVNSDGTLTNFPLCVTGNSCLMPKNITYTTLKSTAQPVGLFAPSTGLWAADVDVYGNVADVLSQSSSGTMAFKLAISVAPTPVGIFGPAIIGTRNYSLSLNNSSTQTASIVPYSDMTCNTAPTTATQLGEADSLESGYTVAARIPLGKCPVFGVSSSDYKRFFVLNRGSDTVTVINSTNNTLDACTPFLNQSGQTVTCHPSLPLSTTAGLAQDTNNDVPAVAGPVYAEYNAAKGLLVVANYDGGTISVIDVSLDEYGNDSPTFGTTFTIPVGKNPASVTVLYDGSRAYTANQADGTVTIVNLSSHTVEKTLTVVGHPRTVVSTQNSSYGKVYVASPDSPYLTIIQTGGTNPDIVDTTVLLTGNIVDVRVTTQNGTSGNSNVNSRMPGAGQPCYLPGSTVTATLKACQTMP